MKKHHSDFAASGAGVAGGGPAASGPFSRAAWEQIFRMTQVPLFVADITNDRAAVQQAAAETGTHNFRTWLDAHPEFVGRIIANVCILEANQAAVDLNAARSREELFVSLEKMILPETLPMIKDLIGAIAEGHNYYEGESRFRALDGREYQALNRVWIPSPDDPFQLMALATIDITDLTRAKQALAESEERYRLLIETARDIIIRHDLNGCITFVNQAGIEVLGRPREELIGLTGNDLLTPAAYGDAMKRMAARVSGNRGVFLYETEYQRADGQAIPLEVSSTLLPGPLNGGGEPQVLLVARDISARQASQQEEQELAARLQNAQKLESLGVLAGGIAHDFNNLLVTILGNTELLRDDLEGNAEKQQSLDAIQEAGEQAAELCRQMQAYAGAAPSQAEDQDLTTVVREIQNLLQVTVSGSSSVHYELAENLPSVLIDPTQVRQVIVNMVSNAAEAVGAQGGEVMIRTGVKDLAPDDLLQWIAGNELKPGRHVFCEVRDSGCGMSQATVSRMFEPFYSTKFTGRGLGLASALGIVKGHDGAFMVTSEPEQGTTVSFWLPVHAESGAPATHGAAASARISFDLRGRTILLVDDDGRVRAVAESYLRRLGCHVLSAANGYDAVRLFGRRHDEIDAIILDYTMPGLDGADTSRRLRVIRPDVPLLISSGHDEAGVRAKSGDLGMAGFVAKPYNLRQLNEVLALALNR